MLAATGGISPAGAMISWTAPGEPAVPGVLEYPGELFETWELLTEGAVRMAPELTDLCRGSDAAGACGWLSARASAAPTPPDWLFEYCWVGERLCGTGTPSVTGQLVLPEFTFALQNGGDSGG